MSHAMSTAQSSTPADDAHKLSYPIRPNDIACVVTSDPLAWAQRTAWDIREHDLARWLDARHGAKPEDFWTDEFIRQRGIEYCEETLKYIIMFNHEEVGGHAVMYIDQILMWQPHYFPYAMKYRCNVDELFEPDQIEHYGRVFLEKVVQWCKISYESNQAYWDAILANPPKGEELERFIAQVEAHHHPRKLKDMRIVPECRPDTWPAEYFAKARGKSAEPLPAVDAGDVHHPRFSISGNAAVRGDGGADSQQQEASSTQTSEKPSTGSASSKSESHEPQAAGNSDQATTEAVTVGNGGDGGAGDDGDDSEPEDKKASSVNSKAPVSPKGKKPVSEESLKVPDSFLHRRVKSESDSPVKPSTKPKLSLADWMTAPGVERRAISTESQSQLITTAAAKSKPNDAPKHGRGGAQQAIGRYEYRAGNQAPVFQHPYPQNFVAINNAAYLYHEDHSFGRHQHPLPDHATTFRPGSNIYQTDPRRGDMFVPNPHPEPHFSQARHHMMHAQPYTAQMCPPHMGMMTQPGSAVMSPHAPQVVAHPPVANAPFGVVPAHIMEPYLMHAESGMWPQTPALLSQVGQPSRHQGAPAIRNPPQYILRAPQQNLFVSPQQQVMAPTHAQPSAPGSHPNHPMVQEGYVHTFANAGAPYVGGRGGHRAFPRAESGHFSPGQPRVLQPRYSGTLPALYSGVFLSRPASGSQGHKGQPRHLSGATQPPQPSSSRSDTIPFPSYTEDAIDFANLSEGQQCTPDFIGPDAEDVDTLWFGNIPLYTTPEQLKEFVETQVPVAEIKKPITFDPAMNAGLGWTFVKFNSNTDARTALSTLHHAELNGGILKVQVPERRTKEGIERRARGGSSFSRYGRSQSSIKGAGPNGQQPSFSGPSTPSRHTNLVTVTGPRTSRGSSMSQAINAVRRNSAFTQQDARSDLPLADLPEVTEPSRPTTPAESTQLLPLEAEHVDPEQPQAPEKPTKKKKNKRKKPVISRDTSVAPSESNLSSAAEASGTSRDVATSSSKDNVKPWPTGSGLIQKCQTEISEGTMDTATSYAEAATSGISSHATEDMASTSTGDQSKIHKEKDQPYDPNSGSGDIATGLEEIESPEPSVMPQEQEAVHASGLSEPTSSAVEEEVIHESFPSESTVPAMKEDDCAVLSETTDIPDVKSETGTVETDQPKPDTSKPIKKKGAAQTESLSIYKPKKKSEKDAEKRKAKKERQASRKASGKSSTSTGALEPKKDDKRNEMEDSSATAFVDKIPSDDIGLGQRKPSEGKGKHPAKGTSDSSSLAGTPKTAREHLSSPTTPTLKGFPASRGLGSADYEQDHNENKNEDDGEANDEPDVATDSGTTEDKTGIGEQEYAPRRTSVFQGMSPSNPTDPIDKETIDAYEQPSSTLHSEHLHVSTSQAAPSKKVPGSKDRSSKSTMTYAQAATTTKKPATTTSTTNTLGLTERDVNVSR